MLLLSFLRAIVLFTSFAVLLGEPRDYRIDERSPLFQRLPNCETGKYPKPKKTTSWKGIVCPMVKNEEGFLSEWVAYYEVQGFDKVIVFDNNSTTPLSELDPWVKAGFVEIVRSPWWTAHKWLFKNPTRKFLDMMHVKYLSEVMCKQRGVELGMDVFASIDIDEYVIPRMDNITLMDDFAALFTATKRGIVALEKFNYNSIPHLLEPLNLLTIEAYSTRMLHPLRMNYYSSVAPKVAMRLRQPENPEFSNDTQKYVINCCDFHGCKGTNNYKLCHPLNQQGGNQTVGRVLRMNGSGIKA